MQRVTQMQQTMLNKLRIQGGWKGKIRNLIRTQKPIAVEENRIINCDNLVKIYKINELEVMALQGLELKINKAELCAIIGSSGSGKTTLLNILGGLETPTAGVARIAGWNLNNMSARDQLTYRREVIGFVWQNIGRNLIPYLTALDNVRLPMILNGKAGDVKWARELLDAVGLGDRIHHKPSEMSGGQQQRVAIAVGLANRPSVLLADEPTGSLDSKTSSEILKVFRTVCERFGITVVVVTHDRSLSNAVDRVVEIRDGKISTETVRTDLLVGSDEVKETAKAGDDYGTESAIHARYTVLDSAGRLQIPKEYLEELGISGRAALEIVDGKIIIKAPAEN